MVLNTSLRLKQQPQKVIANVCLMATMLVPLLATKHNTDRNKASPTNSKEWKERFKKSIPELERAGFKYLCADESYRKDKLPFCSDCL